MSIRPTPLIVLALMALIVISPVAARAVLEPVSQALVELDEIIGDLEQSITRAEQEGLTQADFIDGLRLVLARLMAHREFLNTEFGVTPAFVDAMVNPGNLMAHRTKLGETLHFIVCGSTSGSVWGTGTYTADSALAAAAVHAGVLGDGEWGAVAVTILPGESNYTGSTANSVRSSSYGSFQGSYQVVKADRRATHVLPDPGHLRQFRGAEGQVFCFRLTGATTGSVWGTDTYTDDSILARAAVHAGVINTGEEGIVEVMILPGQASYAASTQNAVASSSYAEYGGSYRIIGRLQ